MLLAQIEFLQFVTTNLRIICSFRSLQVWSRRNLPADRTVYEESAYVIHTDIFMRLLPHHVQRLNPLEKQVYASLANVLPTQFTKRQLFISQSHRYQEGDEDKLPFPERSPAGIMLKTLCEQLARPGVNAAVLKPQIPEFRQHIKSKLRALGTSRVYDVTPSHIAAALSGNGVSPFNYYRSTNQQQLPGLPTGSTDSGEERVLCAIDPPPALVANTDEYTVLAVLLKTAKDPENLAEVPLFTEAAHLGLLQVDELGHDRLWLSLES